MTTSKSNPFVLPGLGQAGELAGNPFLASMEMMRNAWASLSGAGGLAQSLPLTPPMSLEDLDRRINELRTVESWLRMNLSMLSSAIQGMEVQRSTIATLRSFVAAGASGHAPSPLEVVLGLKPGMAAPASDPASDQAAGAVPGSAAGAASDAFPPGSESGSSGPSSLNDAANMGDSMREAAQSASQAWWNLLQQQFNQIASATAASMPAPSAAAAMAPSEAAGAADSPPSTLAARPPSAPRKRATRKTAAKRTSSVRKS